MKQDWYAIAALAKLNHDVSRDKLVKSICAHMHEKATHAALQCENQEQHIMKKQWEAELAEETVKKVAVLPSIGLPDISDMFTNPHGIWVNGKHYTNSPMKVSNKSETLVKSPEAPKVPTSSATLSLLQKRGKPEKETQQKVGKGKNFYYSASVEEEHVEQQPESPTY